MTNPRDPWIHLPLDEMIDDALWDVSGNRRNATASGAVDMVDDPTFGTCLALQGGSLTLPVVPSPRQLTVMAWIRAGDPSLGAPTGRVLTLPMLPRGPQLVAHSSGAADRPGAAGGMYLSLPPSQGELRLPDDEWVHVTIVAQGGPMLSLELIASAIGGEEQRAGGTIPAAVPGMGGGMSLGLAPPIFGGQGTAPPGNAGDDAVERRRREEAARGFRGLLANVRIFTRALEAAEIAELRRADLASASVRMAHPRSVRLSLENEDAAPVLYIDGRPGGHPLTLRVENDSGVDASLAPLGAVPSADRWHFAVVFRPGTLVGVDTVKVDTPGFALASQRSDDGDTLWLLATAPDTRLPLDIALSGLVADARRGTRPTRVQLHDRSVVLAGAPRLAGGGRTQHLSLVNHDGRREVPLQVGFTGPSRVPLGKTADLRLHVTNVLPESMADGRPGALVFGENSRIVLSFDDREGTDWALAGLGELRLVQVRFGVGSATTDARVGELDHAATDRARWTLSLQGLRLEPVDRLEVVLTGVPATGTAGHSNLYVDLIDVPGYWNARVACPIAKVPGPGARAWTDFPLNPGWSAFPGRTPQYLMTEAGAVYLRGACHCSDVGAAFTAPRNPIAFAVPGAIAPDQPLNLHERVQLLRRGQPRLLSYAILQQNAFLAGVWGASPLYNLPDDQGRDVEVRIELDGITYLARSST